MLILVAELHVGAIAMTMQQAINRPQILVFLNF